VLPWQGQEIQIHECAPLLAPLGSPRKRGERGLVDAPSRQAPGTVPPVSGPVSLALGALAGFAVILTIPPWPLPALAMVAAAPLLSRAIAGASFRRVLATGAVFAIAIETLGFYWIPATITTFYSVYFSAGEAPSTVALLLAGVAYLLWCVAESAAWILWTLALWRPPRSPWLVGLWGGGTFALVEWLWPRVFPWSWGTSFAQDPSTWGGLYFLGVEGCAFIVVAGSLWLSEALKGGTLHRRQRVLLAVVGLLFCFSPWWIPSPPSEVETQPMSIGVVQPGISLERRHSHDLEERLGVLREIEEAITQLSADGPLDLIVISEGMLPFAWSDEMVGRWARERVSGPLLIGGFGEGKGGRLTNRAFLLQPPPRGGGEGSGGHSIGFYDKKHLLAFGERIPMRGLLEALGVPLPAADLVAGELSGVFDVNEVKVGVSICYEGTLRSTGSELRSGGAVVHFNITEDLWYGKSAEPQQHLLLATARAIEAGVPLLRVTNGGISAWVDPYLGSSRVIGGLGERVLWRGVIDVPKSLPRPGVPWSRKSVAILPLLALLWALWRLWRAFSGNTKAL